MPDHDELSRRLRAMAADAAQHAEMQTGGEVRRRAGRRRTATVFAASVAAAGLVMGSYTFAASLDDRRGLGPVTPPSPTASIATKPIPTDPTKSKPTESKPTESQPTETSTTTEGDWITTIPANVKLPHEGDVSDDGDVSDWEPDPSWRSWRLLPCLDQKGYPSDADQTDRRSILQTGPEFARAEQLALYPDATTAAIAIDEMQASLADCAEQLAQPDRYGNTYDYYWGTFPAELSGRGFPDDDFHAWNWYRMYNSQGQETGRLGGEFFTVVREGNAIYLMMSGGKNDYSNRIDVGRTAVAQAREAAKFMQTLCRFAGPAGC